MSTDRRPSSKSCILTAAALAGSALLPGTVAAQSSQGERVYVDLGRWTIFEEARPQSCTLRHGAPNRVRLVMSKYGTNDGLLSLELPSRNVFVGNVTFAFDEDEFPARTSGSRLYAPDADGSDIETAFRQARRLTLRQGEATLASISLDGSSAGFRLLKQCAEQGRLGMALAETPASAPEPAVLEPEPVIEEAPPPPSPAPSLARPPVPRDPQSWVRESDSRQIYSRDLLGTVRYTLMVNSSGRAEECVIDANSGPRELGERVCRTMIRRSRFVPALDRNGEETAGSWSSAITFEYSQ